MPAFLDQLEALIRAEYAEQDGMVEEFLSGEPVSEAEIAAAEKELGTPFPALYRALLLRFGANCYLGIEIDDLAQVVETQNGCAAILPDTKPYPPDCCNKVSPSRATAAATTLCCTTARYGCPTTTAASAFRKPKASKPSCWLPTARIKQPKQAT